MLPQHFWTDWVDLFHSNSGDLLPASGSIMVALVNVGPLPSVYALFLVFTYTARKFTALLRLDEDKTGKWATLEKLGLTAALLVGIAYILYVLIAIGKKKLNSTSPTSIAVAENDTVIHPYL